MHLKKVSINKKPILSITAIIIILSSILIYSYPSFGRIDAIDLRSNESFENFLASPEFFYLDESYSPHKLIHHFNQNSVRDPALILITDISSDDPDYKFIYNPVNISYHALISYFLYFYQEANDEYIQDFWRHLNWMIKNETVLDNGAVAVPYQYDWKAYTGYYLQEPWISGLSQAFFIRILIRAYWLTNDTYYLEKAQKHAEVFFIPVEDGGVLRTLEDGNICFEEWPTEGLSLSLNGFMASQIALMELYKETKDEEILDIVNRAVNSLDALLPKFNYIKDDDKNWSSYDLHERPVPVIFRLFPENSKSIPDIQISKISVNNYSAGDFVENIGEVNEPLPFLKIPANTNLGELASNGFVMGTMVPEAETVVRGLPLMQPLELIMAFTPTEKLDMQNLNNLNIREIRIINNDETIWQADLSNDNIFPVNELNGWGSAQGENGEINRQVFATVPIDNHSAFFVNTSISSEKDDLRIFIDYKYTTGEAVELKIFDGNTYRQIGTIMSNMDNDYHSIEFSINSDLYNSLTNIIKDLKKHLPDIRTGSLTTLSSPVFQESIYVGNADDTIGAFSHLLDNSLSTWGERVLVDKEHFRDAFGKNGIDQHAAFQINLSESYFSDDPSTITVKYKLNNDEKTILQIYDGEKYVTIGILDGKSNEFAAREFPLPMLDYTFARNVTKTKDFLATPSSQGYHFTHAVMLKTLYHITGNEQFLDYATLWYDSLKGTIENYNRDWGKEQMYIPVPLDKDFLSKNYDSHIADTRGLAEDRFAMLSDNENIEIIEAALKEMLSGVDDNATEREKILAILEWISTELEWVISEGQTATDIFQDKKAICGGATKLFLEMCRYLGLPSRRLILDNTNNINGHTTAEIWFDNRWNWFDPQFGLFCTQGGDIEASILSAEEIRINPSEWLQGGFMPTANKKAYETGNLSLRNKGTIRSGHVYHWFSQAREIKGDFYPVETFTFAQPFYTDHAPEVPVDQPIVMDAPKNDEYSLAGDPNGEDLYQIQIMGINETEAFGRTGVNISDFGVDGVGVNRNILLIIENAEIGKVYDIDFKIIGHSGENFKFHVNTLFGATLITDKDIYVPYALPFDIKISCRATRPTMIIRLEHEYADYAKVIQISRIGIREGK